MNRHVWILRSFCIKLATKKRLIKKKAEWQSYNSTLAGSTPHLPSPSLPSQHPTPRTHPPTNPAHPAHHHQPSHVSSCTAAADLRWSHGHLGRTCPKGRVHAGFNPSCCPKGRVHAGFNPSCCPKGRVHAGFNPSCCPKGRVHAGFNPSCCPKGRVHAGFNPSCCSAPR